MTKQINERRPLDEESNGGLNRYLKPSIKLRERDNDRRRFGSVRFERDNRKDES